MVCWTLPGLVFLASHTSDGLPRQQAQEVSQKAMAPPKKITKARAFYLSVFLVIFFFGHGCRQNPGLAAFAQLHLQGQRGLQKAAVQP